MKPSTIMLVLAASLPCQALAENFFTWVDDKGVTHFSATRPSPREKQPQQIQLQSVQPQNVVNYKASSSGASNASTQQARHNNNQQLIDQYKKQQSAPGRVNHCPYAR